MADTISPLISTIEALKAFLDPITSDQSRFIDLEGKDLSRYGTLSLISILVMPLGVISVIDVQTLGPEAFTTASKDGKTLKSILSNSKIAKYFWDVKDDADALWAHHQVDLQGVVDIQLLENASRLSHKKQFVSGPSKAITRDLSLTCNEKQKFIQAKDEVKKLMENDGFATRPPDTKTLEYCTNDVSYLPALRDLYMKRIKSMWLTKAMEQSKKRVLEAQPAGYVPHGSHKAYSPWG
jgi:exonuclease 3'-5' domain-containing protein 1